MATLCVCVQVLEEPGEESSNYDILVPAVVHPPASETQVCVVCVCACVRACVCVCVCVCVCRRDVPLFIFMSDFTQGVIVCTRHDLHVVLPSTCAVLTR